MGGTGFRGYTDRWVTQKTPVDSRTIANSTTNNITARTIILGRGCIITSCTGSAMFSDMGPVSPSANAASNKIVPIIISGEQCWRWPFRNCYRLLLILPKFFDCPNTRCTSDLTLVGSTSMSIFAFGYNEPTYVGRNLVIFCGQFLFDSGTFHKCAFPNRYVPAMFQWLYRANQLQLVFVNFSRLTEAPEDSEPLQINREELLPDGILFLYSNMALCFFCYSFCNS